MRQGIFDEIKSAHPLERVVRDSGVMLKKAGRNLKGLCPFHDERTPSFNLNALGTNYERFRCFGCHASGDVFDYVERWLGYEKRRVVEWLAAFCGIEIAEDSETERAARAWRTSAFQLLGAVADHWAGRLMGTQRIVDYARARGVTRDTAELFRIGYSDPATERTALRELYRAAGDLPTQLGLITDRGSYACMNRLVCPVIAPGGQVHGFSGRKLPDDTNEFRPKFWNSPTSDVYSKGAMVFGLAQARDAITQTGRVILVEGNFDVIALHGHGFPETVAPLGTALTVEQCKLIKRKGITPILALDGDAAGRKATVAAIRVWLSLGIVPDVMALPWQTDPGQLIAGDVGREIEPRPGLWEHALASRQGAIDILAGRWRRAASRGDRRNAATEIAALVDAVPDPILADDIRQAGADASGVAVALLRQIGREQSAARHVVEADSPIPYAELDLVCLFLHHDRILDPLPESEQPDQYIRAMAVLTHPLAKLMLTNMREYRSVDHGCPQVVRDILGRQLPRFVVPDQFAACMRQLTKLERLHAVTSDKPLGDIMAEQRARMEGKKK